MGCGVPFSLLAALWLAGYFLVSPLFSDNRDGSVPRVGKGQPRKWSDMTTPPNTVAGETKLPFSGGILHTLEGDRPARMSFLLVHDLAEHAGALREIAASLARQCFDDNFHCNIYAIDLAGHGPTALLSERQGVFRSTEWLHEIVNATIFIRERNQDTALFLVGVGVGGDIALQASMATDKVTGTVSNGLLLTNEVRFRSQLQIDALKGIFGDIVEMLVHDTKIFIPSIFNFHNFYDDVTCDRSGTEPVCEWSHDAATYEKHISDPLSVWRYSLPSIRSLFTNNLRAASNAKPVLIVTGALDKVFGLEHMEACFEALGGPKMLRVHPHAGHSLLRRPGQAAADGARLVVTWAVAVLEGTLGSHEALRRDLLL